VSLRAGVQNDATGEPCRKTAVKGGRSGSKERRGLPKWLVSSQVAHGHYQEDSDVEPHWVVEPHWGSEKPNRVIAKRRVAKRRIKKREVKKI
jgi:hypothetical protein